MAKNEGSSKGIWTLGIGDNAGMDMGWVRLVVVYIWVDLGVTAALGKKAKGKEGKREER